MRFLAAALAVLALALPGAASAEERIHRFSSDIEIQRDGSVEVTETIDIGVENDRIKHGIFRDFPTIYRDKLGRQIKIGFTLLDTSLDGQPEPNSTEYVSRGIRVKIGDPVRFVPPGEHRYTIRYRATRELGFFETHDELYWGVTGTGWGFPIDVAEARIRLPAAVPFGQRSFYTGGYGSTGQAARVVEERPGEMLIRTTGPLAPREGLTVAVAFPKGVVTPPDSKQRARNFLSETGPPAVALAGLAAILGYYFIAWSRAGRNPRAGTVVPLFTPPDNLSPAEVRYINEMGADDRTLAAAMVDLGVRGKLKLVEREGGWLSKDKTWLIETNSDLADTPRAEAAMARALFLKGRELEMDNENHERFSAAREALVEHLSGAHEDKKFRRNWWWAIAGLALIPAAVVINAHAYAIADGGETELRYGLTGMLALLAAFLLYQGAGALSSGWRMFVRLVAWLVGLAGLAVGALVVPMAFSVGNPLWILAPLLTVPLVVSAFWWMAAPTPEGRAVMDRIAGFKQYLSIAERERLDRMNPPEDTPELFEKYLPYAIALGVETRWADRFHDVLARAAAQPGGQQGFLWYSGSGNPWSNTGGFVSTIGSSLASTISSSASAPGSSSGSGGGGFSGGGGGGGGGGGW